IQQVLRTTTSASSRPAARSIPSDSSRPAMRSESCSFIWHPKVRIRYFRAMEGSRLGGGRGCASRCGAALDHEVERRAGLAVDAGGLADALVDRDHQLGVVEQELLGLLLALPELLALIRVPGAGLLHDPVVDADVDDRALAADALAVHDVELGLLERRRDLQ